MKKFLGTVVLIGDDNELGIKIGYLKRMVSGEEFFYILNDTHPMK